MIRIITAYSLLFAFSMAGLAKPTTLQWHSLPTDSVTWTETFAHGIDEDFIFTANISTHLPLADEEASIPCWNLRLTGVSGELLNIRCVLEMLEIAGIFEKRIRMETSGKTNAKRHDAAARDWPENPMRIIITREDSIFTIEYGAAKLSRIKIPAPPEPLTGICFTPSPGFRNSLNFASLTFDSFPSAPEIVFTSGEEEIKKISRESLDPLEGIWRIYDHSEDTSFASPGGDYTLGILSNDNAYDIIYLSGAIASSEYWKSGMRKGKLTPTPTPGIYRAEWLDADFIPAKEVSALLEGDYLTISFPHLYSKITFRKE